MTNDERELLQRITVDPGIFGGKPIVRGRRLAVEHVLGLLAAGDTLQTLFADYPWLERADVQACLVFARRVAAQKGQAPPSDCADPVVTDHEIGLSLNQRDELARRIADLETHPDDSVTWDEALRRIREQGR